MNFLDRAIAGVAPVWAKKRMQARMAMKLAAMHYDAATTGRRSKSWRPSGSDADGASQRRDRLAYVSRDMIRNTPFAFRAQQVITNNTISDGIIPKVKGANDAQSKRGLALIEQHFDTVAIDADGRQNLYGLQRVAMNAIVDAGEVIIRRRRRDLTDNLPLPFQIQVLEADYIDTAWDGVAASGNPIKEGIEYDLIGRRVAYYLFDEHPGAALQGITRGRYVSRRVPASEILHIYRQDRPGQQRGVSWFAPVALNLTDLGDYQDAQLVRQKIAACFAAFRYTPDADIPRDDEDPANVGVTLNPGAITTLNPGEDIRFADPPGVDGFDEFNRVVLRSVAAGLGITYEALVGDMSQVNFSSARMGRLEMNRNVSSWQWLMMVPQFLGPLGEWFNDAWALRDGDRRIQRNVSLTWVPPHPIIVDPNREIPAMMTAIAGGLESWQGTVRSLGKDPERLLEEMKEDRQRQIDANLAFKDAPGYNITNEGSE
jgi:lambda family phage portal protein